MYITKRKIKQKKDSTIRQACPAPLGVAILKLYHLLEKQSNAKVSGFPKVQCKNICVTSTMRYILNLCKRVPMHIFDCLKSFFQVKKSNPDAKPPKRTPKFFKVRWKSSAIRIKDGHLILSNGQGKEPVILEGVKKNQSMLRCISSADTTISHLSIKLTFLRNKNRYYCFCRYG